MKINITLLYVCFVLLFVSCNKVDVPAEVPEKYMQFFPYYEGQRLLFKTSTDTMILHVIQIESKIDEMCHGEGWKAYVFVNYKISTLSGKYLSKLFIKSCFWDNRNEGSISCKADSIIDPISGRSVQVKWDDDIIAECIDCSGSLTFIKQQGLSKIKWPQKESVSKSKIESYPNTPWGETWTLIE